SAVLDQSATDDPMLPVDAPEPSTAAAAPAADATAHHVPPVDAKSVATAAAAASPTDPTPSSRGRPRKRDVLEVQQPEAQADSAVLDQSAIDDPMPPMGPSQSAANTAASAAEPTPKKRGRPSKSVAPKLQQPVTAAATSTAEPTPKKRGRPSKSVAPLPVAVTAASTSDAPVNLVAPGDASQPVAKKPTFADVVAGLKKPLAEQKQAKPAAAATASSAAPTPRKPGRPRKNAVEKPEEDSDVLDQSVVDDTMPLVGPSRPTATAAAAADGSELDAATPTTAADPTPTRKRGRPRKFALPADQMDVAGSSNGGFMAGLEPFPSRRKLIIDLLVKKEDLALDKTVMAGRYWLGRIPFTVHTLGRRRSSGKNQVGVLVKCNEESDNNNWTVDTEITVTIEGDDTPFVKNKSFNFNDDYSSLAIPRDLEQVTAEDSKYANEDGKIPIKVVIKTLKLVGIAQPMTYTVKNGIPDATIFVGGTLVYVCREQLARGSRFFYKAYYGPDGEKNAKMMEIDDCTTEEFVTLFNQLYDDECLCTPDNVISMLRLADRFKMQTVVTMGIVYFKNLDTPSLPMLKQAFDMLSDVPKIKVGDNYHLSKMASELQNYLIKAIFEGDLFDELKNSALYKDRLSSDMKVRLLEEYYSITSGRARH
ncbi:hypothetical protein PENTCL1PPCAC_10855, partial [Pristionchus entomophagus]